MRSKLAAHLLALAVSGLWSSASSLRAQPQMMPPELSPSGQEHVRRLIQELPEDCYLRQMLESGRYGPDTHHAWMDDMRREGVKSAVFEVELFGPRKPENVRIAHIVYFSEYDSDCSQITQPEQLANIRASGLESELCKVAVQRTLKTPWMMVHGPRHLKQGGGVIHLYDDEWIPYAEWLVPKVKMKGLESIDQAVNLGDLAEATALLHAGVSPEERDKLMGVAILGDEACIMAALLKTGGNANLSDKDGYTFLMGAANSRALRIARLLLAAGADVNAKTKQGDTALSIARRQHDHAMYDLLKDAGARD